MRLKWILFILIESLFVLLFIGVLVYSLRDESFLSPRNGRGDENGVESPSPGAGLLRVAGAGQSSGAAGQAFALPDGLLAQDDPSLQPIAVQAVWRDTGQPAVGTSVTLYRARGPEPDWRQSAHTDGDGLCALTAPADWMAVDLLATHPDGADHRMALTLPMGRPVLVEMRKAGAIFGTLYRGQDMTPLAGADVYVYTASGMLLKQARSEGDGRYELTHLVGSGLKVFARHGDLLSDINDAEAGPLRVFGGERQGPRDLILHSGAEVVGVVRDAETGRPVAGASVRVSYRERDHVARTDAAGAYRLAGLPTQRLSLTARAPGYILARRTVSPARDQATECDFTLQAGGIVRVHVQNPDGAPIARAWVALADPGDPESPLEEAWTNRAGVAVLEGVDLRRPPGILAAREGYEPVGAMPRTFRFPQGAQETSVTLTLARVPQGGYFSGVVMDDAGAPIANAVVQWISVGVSLAPMTWTDEDGTYLLQAGGGDGARSGLAAFADGFSPDVVVDVTPGTWDFPTEVDFVLQGAHWLEVLVVDPDGQPLEGASVIILLPQEDSIPLPVAGHGEPRLSDDDGLILFENVPGPQLSLMAGIPGHTTIEQQLVDVDQRVEVTLQPLGEIWGVVLDLNTGEPIPQFTIVREEAVNWGPVPVPSVEESFSSPDGEFVIDGLMTDRLYDLIASAEGYLPARFENAQPEIGDTIEEVVFRLAPERTEVGVVVEAESGLPIADARVAQAWFEDERLSDWDALDDSNPQLWEVQETLTDAEGEFVLLEAEEKTLFILAPGWARRVISPQEREALPRDEDDRFVVALEPGGDLWGQYREEGRPVLGQQLLLARAPEAGESLLGLFLTQPETVDMMGMDQTDRGGQFGWESLPEGLYQVAALLEENGVAIFRHTLEIELPAGVTQTFRMETFPGPFTLSGALLRSDGAPLSPGVLYLQPEFDWEYSNFGAVSGVDGHYAIHGLRAGWYAVTLMRLDLADGAMATIHDRIQITENTAADFIFSQGNAVTGRLEFWPPLPDLWSGVYNQVLLRAEDMGRADRLGLTPYAIGILEDGAFLFRGRFQGPYGLVLSSATGGEYLDPEVTIPIDNLDGAVDLGAIATLVFGHIHLSLDYLADQWPDPPMAMTLRLQPDPEEPSLAAPQTIHLHIASHPLDRMLERIPIGAYQVELFFPSYIAEPRAAHIIVPPGDTVEVRFFLTPGEGPVLEPEY